MTGPERLKKIESLAGSFLNRPRTATRITGILRATSRKRTRLSEYGVENGTATLTYKGPKIGERSKTRFEREVGFDDVNAMRDILDRLGFAVVSDVRKTRLYYSLGETEICVDNVDGLGDFVELEIKGTDRERGETILFGTAAKLGLTRFERKSYLELLLEKNA